MRRTIAALAAAGALALPATAGADAHTGAEHIDVSKCEAFGMGFTVCIEQEGVIKYTENANNVSGFTHLRQTMSVSNNACDINRESELKSHFLVQKDEEGYQVAHEKSEVVTTAECLGGSVRCTISANYHFANGRVQYDAEIVRCENL